MTTTEKEPTPTIRGELGRRRHSVGRLAAATELSEKVLQSRLNDPDAFRLGEIARIATALELTTEEVLAAWLAEAGR